MGGCFSKSADVSEVPTAPKTASPSEPAPSAAMQGNAGNAEASHAAVAAGVSDVPTAPATASPSEPAPSAVVQEDTENAEASHAAVAAGVSNVPTAPATASPSEPAPISVAQGDTNAPPAAAAPPPEKIPPMVPAVMRNAHEVLRSDIKLLQAAADADDLAGFAAAWTPFLRFLKVHMAMEDAGMFGLLDSSFDNAISKEGLGAEHTHDKDEAAAVQAAIDVGDVAALRKAWAVFGPHHLEHLAHEERVLMPLVGRIGGGDAAKRAAAFGAHIIAPGLATGDFDFLVSHGIGILATHGSTENDAKTASRVFANGLRGCTTPSVWERLRPLVRAAMPADVWASAVAVGDLDGPGLLPEQ